MSLWRTYCNQSNSAHRRCRRSMQYCLRNVQSVAELKASGLVAAANQSLQELDYRTRKNDQGMEYLGHPSSPTVQCPLPLALRFWSEFSMRTRPTRREYLVQCIEWRRSDLFLCHVPAVNIVVVVIVALHVEAIVGHCFMGPGVAIASRRRRKDQRGCS